MRREPSRNINPYDVLDQVFVGQTIDSNRGKGKANPYPQVPKLRYQPTTSNKFGIKL